jgi:hypothetical protein
MGFITGLSQVHPVPISFGPKIDTLSNGDSVCVIDRVWFVDIRTGEVRPWVHVEYIRDERGQSGWASEDRVYVTFHPEQPKTVTTTVGNVSTTKNYE